MRLSLDAVHAPALRPPAPWVGAASAMWWLHPLAVLGMVSVVYATFPAFEFSRVVPRAYIPGPQYAWGAALLLGMAVGIGSLVIGRPAPPQPLPRGFDVPRWAMALLLMATVLAYAVWFAPLAENPQLLLDVLGGERSTLRGVVATTPGLTTMTQFGVAYAIACAALQGGRARPLALWEQLGLVAVLALAVMRAVAWSERLAVIEVVVCYGVARLAFVQVHRRGLWILAATMPIVAPLLLYVAFTATESVRSWTFYRDQYDSVWSFAFERLLAYYATASNNGIGLLVENTDWPAYTGRFVAEWLYMMPLLGEQLRDALGDVMPQYDEFLERFARPEFNNPTGLFPIVFDIGYVGSMLYFVAVGALIGRLWDGWRHHSPAGVLLYPPAALFLIELLRFNYLSATRFFPIALALFGLWMVARPPWQPPVLAGTPR